MEIDLADGLNLLGLRGSGHLGVSVGALPVVLPVRYLVDGAEVVLLPSVERQLGPSLRDAVVCLSVDTVDLDGSAVALLVTGMARADVRRGTVLSPVMVRLHSVSAAPAVDAS